MRTENAGITPVARSIHAQNTTEITKAALPSKVFDELGDQRCRPMRLPTIDAYPWCGKFTKLGRAYQQMRTNASPTPNDNTPVNSSMRDGLEMGSLKDGA